MSTVNHIIMKLTQVKSPQSQVKVLGSVITKPFTETLRLVMIIWALLGPTMQWCTISV